VYSTGNRRYYSKEDFGTSVPLSQPKQGDGRRAPSTKRKLRLRTTGMRTVLFYVHVVLFAAKQQIQGIVVSI
jgi:hypothetical protein